MKSIGQLVSGVLGVLVLIGVVKGLNATDMGGADLGELMGAIINGVADLTIYLIPNLIEALSST